MLKDNLNELGEYIEKINSSKPVDLLETRLEEIEKIYSPSKINVSNEFNKDLLNLIKFYNQKGVSNSEVIYQLYFFLIDYTRRSLIEEKADMLGIDKKLYKNEMGLLFKGKKPSK